MSKKAQSKVGSRSAEKPKVSQKPKEMSTSSSNDSKKANVSQKSKQSPAGKLSQKSKLGKFSQKAKLSQRPKLQSQKPKYYSGGAHKSLRASKKPKVQSTDLSKRPDGTTPYADTEEAPTEGEEASQELNFEDSKRSVNPSQLGAAILTPKAKCATLAKRNEVPSAIVVMPEECSQKNRFKASNRAAKRENPNFFADTKYKNLWNESFELDVKSPGIARTDCPPPTAVEPNSGFCQLYAAKPLVIDTCLDLLEMNYKRWSRVNLNFVPMNQFCVVQASLCCRDLIRCGHRQNMTNLLIKEHVDNLICLYDLLFEHNQESIAEFRRNLCTLIQCITEACNHLETMCKQAITDWKAIATGLQAVPTDIPKRTPWYYVPQMEDFVDPKEIGQGIYGHVYQVTFKPLCIPMVLKVIPFCKFSNFAQSEFSYCRGIMDPLVATVIGDPFIVKTYCCFKANPDVLCVLSEYPSIRTSLGNIIRSGKQIPADWTVIIATQIILGLEALHYYGIIHRDITLNNCIADEAGRVFICDFDMAVICCGHFDTTKVHDTYFARTHVEFSTAEQCQMLEYCAPEIIKGIHSGRSADWWSLGVCIYILSTGKLPFRSAKPDVLRNKILTETVNWPKATEQTPSLRVTRQFVFDLLIKRAKHRLPSKCYSEIYSHEFIKRFHALIPDFAQNETMVCEVRLKLLFVEALLDFKTFVTGSNVQCKEVSSKHVDLKKVTNCSFNEQWIGWEAGQRGSAEYHLGNNATPPRPLFQFPVDVEPLAPEDSELSDSPAFEQRLVQLVWSPVSLKCKTNPWKVGCDLEIITGDGGLSYTVAWNEALVDEKQVMDGDIIVSMNGYVTSATEFNSELLDVILQDAAANNLVTIGCDVLSLSTFRLYRTDPAALLKLIKDQPRQKIAVSRIPSQSRANPIETRKITIGKESFHVVSRMGNVLYNSFSILPLFGDVLISVASVNISSLSSGQVIEKLNQELKNTLTNIEFVELSLLRRCDLLEESPPP